MKKLKAGEMEDQIEKLMATIEKLKIEKVELQAKYDELLARHNAMLSPLLSEMKRANNIVLGV